MASDDEKCEAKNCKIFKCKDSELSWVQCEKCDRWWHCFCAECSESEIKKKDFICEICVMSESIVEDFSERLNVDTCSTEELMVNERTECENKTEAENKIKVSQFHRSLKHLPDIKQEHIVLYLNDKGRTISNDTDNAFQRQFKRGYKFFVEGYLHDIKCKDSENDFMCKCKCFRSMKKSEKPHTVTIVLCKKSNNVQYAKCSCTSGLSEACNHIVALLHYLCHASALGLTEVPDDVSCTGLPQKWHTPRGKQVDAKPVREVQIKKPIFGKAKFGLKNSLYNPRPMSKRGVDEDSLRNLKSKMQQHVKNCVFPLLFDDISYVDRGSYRIPTGSILSYHHLPAQYPDIQSTNSAAFPLPTINPSIVEIKKPNIFTPEETKFLNDLSLDVTECIQLEAETRNQAESENWQTERTKRLTSSNFGRIMKRKKDDASAICQQLISTTFKGKRLPKALEHGKVCEPFAATAFIESRKKLEKYVELGDCGLVVHPQCPWLAASPDRKVFDPSIYPPEGLLEIKCPLTGYGKNVSDLCENNKFCCEMFNNQIKLKRNHDYYMQIQGQLACTGLKWCYLYVFTGDETESFCELIERDDTFINMSLLPTLSGFYFNKFIKFKFRK